MPHIHKGIGTGVNCIMVAHDNRLSCMIMTNIYYIPPLLHFASAFDLCVGLCIGLEPYKPLNTSVHIRTFISFLFNNFFHRNFYH